MLDSQIQELRGKIYDYMPPGINDMPPIVLMATNEDVPVASGDTLDIAVIVPEKFSYQLYGMTGVAYAGNLATPTIISENFDYKVQIFSRNGAWEDKYVWKRVALPSTTFGNVIDGITRPSRMYLFPRVLQVAPGEQIKISFTNNGTTSGVSTWFFQIAFHGYRIFKGNILQLPEEDK